jgi:hypothetical protein
MTQSTPTREVLWNISNIWLMYLLFAVALAIALVMDCGDASQLGGKDCLRIGLIARKNDCSVC